MPSIAIEKLLRWAYREELPKRRERASAPGALAASFANNNSLWQTLVTVDGGGPVNAYGLVADLAAAGGPDPEAERVVQAVLALDELTLGFPEGWDPLADLGDLDALGEEAIARGVGRLTRLSPDGKVVLHTRPSQLILKHAVLGGEPDWQAETPEVKPVLGLKGRPRWFVREPDGREVDGFCPTGRRPREGAYRKWRLDPDPVDAVVERGEYEIWRVSLDLLVEALGGRTLAGTTILPTDAPMRPWETGARIAPRVLRDLTQRRRRSA